MRAQPDVHSGVRRGSYRWDILSDDVVTGFRIEREDGGAQAPVTTGVYFYRVRMAGFTATRKMLLVR